jgi:hypothetical protein
MKTHTGSCHCKAVHFEVELDVAKATRCNCSICMKLGATGCIVKPAELRLLAGEENLGVYEWGMKVAGRRFCRTCGVFVFGKGYLAELGGDFVSVNLNCLDDVDAARLSPVHWDGRHDNWEAGPRNEPWPVFA